MPDANDVLVGREIYVAYPEAPGLWAVEGANITVGAGEVVGLIGESGAGKSSLARAVAGLERRSGGSVEIGGRRIPKRGVRGRAARTTGIQMIVQDPNASLDAARRVIDQVGDGVSLGRARRKRSDVGAGAPELGAAPTAAEWLTLVGVDPAAGTRLPRQFSGGQKQRIAVARALATSPRVLIVDEPISALDAEAQEEMMDLLRARSVHAGTGMLFLSHDLALVRRVSDRVYVMHEGRIVETGDTEVVWNDPQHEYTRELLAFAGRA
jgi:peptide/nickel transport system ATP-binding protein